MPKIEVKRVQLGTPIVLTVVTENEVAAREAVGRAFEECMRIENSYSRFTEGNELAALNARLGKWTTVSAELFQLIAFAKRVGEKTAGAFDLSVKSILEGWGYDSNYSLREGFPGQTGTVEFENGRVRISAPIELGGLGKGYVLDCMLSFLSDFPNVHLNAGGDLTVRGVNEEGKPWRIVFEHPEDVSRAIGYLDTTSLALACSSPSRRRWKTRGKDSASPSDRHHLVDPRTGKPANAMLAVYTQSSSALLADVYSTALFVLGYEEARKLLPTLPVAALLVSPDGKIFRSEGFQGILF